MSIHFPSFRGSGPVPEGEFSLKIAGIKQLTLEQEKEIRGLVSSGESDPALIESALQKLGITEPEEQKAIVNYILHEIHGDLPPPVDPKEKKRPSVFEMAGKSVKLGTKLTPDQEGMTKLLAQNLVGYTTNYQKNLAQMIKNGATPLEIFEFKQKAQQQIDALFADGGQMRASLLSVGLKDPELSQVIKDLKAKAGFDPRVDDLGTNFKDELTAWSKAPGRTAGEKQFAEELLKLIQPSMTNDQLQSVLNKFLGNKDQDIFKLFGFDPKNFKDIAAMLPGLQVHFPIPSDIENAYVQSFKLDDAAAKLIRSALDSHPNDFAAFKAYVSTSILPKAPANERDLIRELSGNQPVNQNLPATRPDGSALFTYVNSSGVPDSQVYIQIIGVDPNTGKQCFVQYGRDGTPHYIDATPGMDSSKYAFPLSYFNRSQDGKGASFYLPSLNGGRLYQSIGEPLRFGIDLNGGIMNPNPHRLDDPNNAIMWDKIEFTTEAYKDSSHQGMIFLNTTAVDNVTLPMLVSVMRKDGTMHEGGLVQGVYDQLVKELTTMGPPWSGLIQGNTILSIMDAASTDKFPQDFFVTPQKGQTKSWMDGFIEKYLSHALQISTNDSLTPGDDGKGIWNGTIDPKTHKMVFTRKPPGQPSPPAVNSVTIAIPSKTSELLSGTGDGWEMGSVKKLTDQLRALGLYAGDKTALSDEEIQKIINGLPNNNPNKAILQKAYSTMKIQINLARDISVGVCTNTLGAKGNEVMSNRLCQLAQDGQIPKDIIGNRKQVNGNWTPPFTDDQIKQIIDKLPVANTNKAHLQLLESMMSGSNDAPLCQDTFTAAFQTAFANNPNMPSYAQYIDPVALIVAENAIKMPGHEEDRLGNIYTSPYTDSTGHEGAADSIPSEYANGTITLGNIGSPLFWTS